MTVVKIDQEIQVEFFEEEIGEMYDPFGGGKTFHKVSVDCY